MNKRTGVWEPLWPSRWFALYAILFIAWGVATITMVVPYLEEAMSEAEALGETYVAVTTFVGMAAGWLSIALGALVLFGSALDAIIDVAFAINGNRKRETK